MRIRNLAITALAMGASYPPFVAHAEEELRQLGPHVHGHGTVSIAIDANKVLMELRAPGMDIVGFEHEADGPDQMALVEAARKDLQDDALKLFVLPKSAGCKVTSSKAEVIAEEHDGDHEGESSKGETHSADNAMGGEQGEHHNEFHAVYALTCSDATKLTSIDFAFFDRFTGSQDLDVTIVDASGQNAYEVSRESRRLERSGP